MDSILVNKIDALARSHAGDALRALMAEGEYEAVLLRDYVMGIGYR